MKSRPPRPNFGEPEKEVRIAVTGGGTGGHVSPALATVQAIRAAAQGSDWTPAFLYIGSANGIERKLAGEAGLPFRAVASGKMRRAAHWRGLLSAKNMIDFLRVPVGVAQSVSILGKFRPHVLLATGGYVSVPPVLAASLLRVPILIHEQTVQVGLANKIAARAATRIALSFGGAVSELPAAARAKAFETGNPVREIIFSGDKSRAVSRFGLDESDNNLPCVYVTGGAQGAQAVNRVVETILPQVLEIGRVLHQCGAQDEAHFRDVVRQLPAKLARRYWTQGFVGDEIGDAYALADVVAGRSGAGTVAEAAALGKPAIFIPLVPTGGDEQTKNARRMADAGAAVLLPGAELTPGRLLHELGGLLTDPARRDAMGQAARTLARPNAARELAAAALALAGVAGQAEIITA